jgi:hypothetical protein
LIDLGIKGAPVNQRNLDFISLANDMMIGQDIAVLCVDDDTRSGTTDFTRPPEWITAHLRYANIDDGRRRRFDQRCERECSQRSGRYESE